MAHPPERKAQVREAYVRQGLTLEVAAASAGVAYGTAREWKRAAEQAGDDWDRARNARRLAEGGLGSMTTQVLEQFAVLFEATMQRLQVEPGPAIETAEAIARLSDAWVKTTKAAGTADPKFSRYAVALEVLEAFVAYLRDEGTPADLERFGQLLEPFGRRVSEMYA